MTTLDFMASAANIRCVLVRASARQAWDTTGAGAWVALPADGTIPPACILTAVPMATVGKLRNVFSLQIGIDPSDLAGASVLVYLADGRGNLGDLIDLYPSPYLAPVAVTRGGWNRA